MYPKKLEAEKYAASSTDISGAEQGSGFRVQCVNLERVLPHTTKAGPVHVVA